MTSSLIKRTAIIMNYKDKIKQTVSRSIESFFLNKKVVVSHPLDLIFPKERRIRSLIGGLETSLGTKVWEPLAKMFAKNNGFEILNEKEFNLSVPEIPEQIMHKLSDFENQKLNDPSLKHSRYREEIIEYINVNNIQYSVRRKIQKGEGVDVWLSKGGKEFLIDIKTVQLNAGGGPKFNKNLLKWYTYRALESERKIDTRCILAFPFNPHKKDYWQKEGGKVLPLVFSEEALVGNEFWDLLSGEKNTMELIFDAFKELREENFGDQFDHIFRIDN